MIWHTEGYLQYYFRLALIPRADTSLTSRFRVAALSLRRSSVLLTKNIQPRTTPTLISEVRAAALRSLLNLDQSETHPRAQFHQFDGVVRPVSGMTRVTPPMTMKHCRAMTNERPTPSSAVVSMMTSERVCGRR